MKRIITAFALAAALVSLNSCGLPGAVLRSAGNLVQGLDNMASSTMN